MSIMQSQTFYHLMLCVYKRERKRERGTDGRHVLQSGRANTGSTDEELTGEVCNSRSGVRLVQSGQMIDRTDPPAHPNNHLS